MGWGLEVEERHYNKGASRSLMTIQTDWPQGLTDRGLPSRLLYGCSSLLTLPNKQLFSFFLIEKRWFKKKKGG